MPTAHQPEFMVTLGLAPPYTIEDVKEAYRTKAMQLHPDKGGDTGQFNELHEAFVQASQYVKFRVSRRDWLGELVDTYAAQENLADELARLGARIVIEEMPWMQSWLGSDFAQVLDRIVEVDLRHSQQANAAMEMIAKEYGQLEHLRVLDLSGVRGVDGGLDCIARLAGLETLRLDGCQLSPQGLAALDQALEARPLVQTVEWSTADVGAWQRARLRFRHRDIRFMFRHAGSADATSIDDDEGAGIRHRSAIKEEFTINEQLQFVRKPLHSPRPWWKPWR